MKKIVILGLIGIIVFFGLISNSDATSNITLYLFRGEGCPHCEAAIEYLDSIKKEYPMMEVVTYEVFNDHENAQLWNDVKKTLNSDSKGVPFIVIGERFLTGFAEYRKADIKAALEYYRNHPEEYKDVVTLVKNDTGNEEAVTTPTAEEVKPVEMHTKRDQLYQNLAICIGLLVLCGGIYYWLGRQEKRA